MVTLRAGTTVGYGYILNFWFMSCVAKVSGFLHKGGPDASDGALNKPKIIADNLDNGSNLAG